MKTKYKNKRLLCVLCMVLLVAMAQMMTGCTSQKEKEPVVTQKEEDKKEVTVVGEGSKKFLFSVVDSEEKETCFEVHTDKTIVGEALQELGLLEGKESEYGLYVTTVNGIYADYDTDGVYWAFYIDGEYAQTGVDSTEIKEDAEYSFKVQK